MFTSAGVRRPDRLEDLLDPALMARLDALDLRSKKIFAGKLQGERRSKRRGQSVEFDDFRNYSPGDDLRYIDWNIYARLDRLFVKLFLEEEDLALHIVLDASASMDTGDPNKLIFASRIAMALGYLGLVQQNRVGLTVFGVPGMQNIARLPDTRGRRQVRRVADFLIERAFAPRRGAAITTGAPGAQADFNAALTTIARMRIGKGVMVLLSDFLVADGYQPALKALAAAGGYDTYCLQILSPQETDPETATAAGLAGDLRLTDIETGHAAEVTVSAELIRRYKQRLAEYTESLTAYCNARQMTHRILRSDADPQKVILETLRREGMVG
ncbi:MAG: DUF58 domain-containing protein [Phycisphaerales bacterium]